MNAYITFSRCDIPIFCLNDIIVTINECSEQQTFLAFKKKYTHQLKLFSRDFWEGKLDILLLNFLLQNYKKLVFIVSSPFNSFIILKICYISPETDTWYATSDSKIKYVSHFFKPIPYQKHIIYQYFGCNVYSFS